MNKCQNCNKDTNNPKFCSRSCSAIISNKLYPRKAKRSKLHNCRLCGKHAPYRRILCISCKSMGNLGDVTLAQATYAKHHKSSAFALVRARARKILSDTNECQKCGYNKHVEVCHIKPISSFSEDTLLSVINSRDNLMILCPNCHWELDHQ